MLSLKLKIPYVDAHCHVYGLSIERLKKITTNTIIVGVAEDLDSSKKVIEISKQINNVIPMIGIHPWNVAKISYKELQDVVALLKDAKGFGEIGLDGKTKSFEKQVDFFERFLEVASEYDVPVNIHSRAAWREVIDLLFKYEIKKAILHWYSGPKEFLKDLEVQGYMITINPSVIFQQKHQKILETAPLSMILTESDGPYQYRGKYLTPAEIPSLVAFIAKVKQTAQKRVRRTIFENLKKYFSI